MHASYIPSLSHRSRTHDVSLSLSLSSVLKAGEPSVYIGCNDPDETSCKASLWGVGASCPSLNVPCGSYLVISDGGNYCYGYSPNCNRRGRGRQRRRRTWTRRGLLRAGGIATIGTSTTGSFQRDVAEGPLSEEEAA